MTQSERNEIQIKSAIQIDLGDMPGEISHTLQDKYFTVSLI